MSLASIGRVQVGAGRKIRHPQVIDEGGFEALGGTAQGLAQLRPSRFGVQLMFAQEPVDGVKRRQLGILFAPPSIEHFDRHGQMGLSLFEDPLLLFGTERAGLAFIGSLLGGQGGEAAVLVSIPPVFDGARRMKSLRAVGHGERTKAHLFQGHR